EICAGAGLRDCRVFRWLRPVHDIFRESRRYARSAFSCFRGETQARSLALSRQLRLPKRRSIGHQSTYPRSLRGGLLFRQALHQAIGKVGRTNAAGRNQSAGCLIPSPRPARFSHFGCNSRSRALEAARKSARPDTRLPSRRPASLPLRLAVNPHSLSQCAARYRFSLSCTALRVASSVKARVSFGILVTNGPTSHPSPVGISRVSEATSLCT